MRRLLDSLVSQEDKDFGLIMAVVQGDAHEAELWLAIGADIHVYDDVPLAYAAVRGELEVVDLLLRRGAGLKPRALRNAAIEGHLEVLKKLMEHKPVTDTDKKMLLHLAAARGHSQMVRYLVDKGAGPQALGCSVERAGGSRPVVVPRKPKL